MFVFRVLRHLTILAVLGFASCSPPQTPLAPSSAPVASVTLPTAPTEKTAVAPTVGESGTAAAVINRVAKAPKVIRTDLSGIGITAVVFDPATHRLVVADQPEGPGSRWTDAQVAGRAFGGLAALNAGFFTPEGKPLGLVVAGGRSHGSINRTSSLGSGFYADGALLRRERWTGKATEALQSGPFLVEGRRPVAGLSHQSSSARSFVARLEGGRWLLARTGPCSLADLGTALAGSKWDGAGLVDALNLDGGRSSEFWVASGVDGGPLRIRPAWNRPVRNFLVLVPRD